MELEEASKALTVFTVGPLEFYKCGANAIRADKCSGDVSAPNGDFLGNLQF